MTSRPEIGAPTFAYMEYAMHLEAEIERLKAELVNADETGPLFVRAGVELAKESEHLRAENERLRARLCYVNPDGSHVRGCAQHEAEHPAQWCETLARDKRAYVDQT